jgi:hypothetical protein
MIKILNLVSKKEMKKETNTEVIYLTKKEQDLLYDIVQSQIDWQEGGCLINDNQEVDKSKMKLAKSILTKI